MGAGVHARAIKDMAGLLSPPVTRALASRCLCDRVAATYASQADRVVKRASDGTVLNMHISLCRARLCLDG